MYKRQVQESARQNAPHHAASQPLPSGRPSSSAAGSGGAAGGSGGTAGRASEPDHDDGEEDDLLRKANYYTITPQQRAFNEEKTLHFINNAAKLSHAYFEPPDVSKSGCDPKFIGVGKVHVHAPHLFLGLAKPPCPTCGWNVDSNTVKTKGVCGARRVYAAEIDEWVSGQKMLCTVCKQGRDRLKAEWQASPHPNSNPNPNPNPNPDPNPNPKQAEHEAELLEEPPLASRTASEKASEEATAGPGGRQDRAEAGARAELRAASVRKAQGERFEREAAERAQAERALAERAMQPH